MEFGLERCATLAINQGKLMSTDGVKMQNNSEIKSLEPETTYKYLGILQADNIKHREVKTRVAKKNIRRVREILKSKLNAGSTIQAINTWAVPVVRYTAGIVKWTQTDLENLDRKTQKNNVPQPCTTPMK